MKKRNEEQGRMIVMYNEERLDMPKSATTAQPQVIALLDGPTTATEQTVTPTKATDQRDDREQVEDEFYTKNDPWIISKVIGVYVNHVKEIILRGGQVIIQEINVVNGHLVHNWGILVREELGGKTTVEAQHTNRVKLLQDVRVVAKNKAYYTPTGKVRLQF